MPTATKDKEKDLDEQEQTPEKPKTAVSVLTDGVTDPLPEDASEEDRAKANIRKAANLLQQAIASGQSVVSITDAREVEALLIGDLKPPAPPNPVIHIDPASPLLDSLIPSSFGPMDIPVPPSPAPAPGAQTTGMRTTAHTAVPPAQHSGGGTASSAYPPKPPVKEK